jgi:WD40 repeat protein
MFRNCPPEAQEVARECGNLPLALAMTGAMLRGKPNRWGNVLHKLQNADLDKIRRDFPNYPYHDLLKALQVSVEELKPDHQARYLDFAVFPEDTPIPEAVLQTFWESQGLDQYAAQDMLDLLVDRSLVRRDEDGNLSLHDLQFDYVKKQSGDLTALHNRLLEAYRAKYLNTENYPAAWAEGPNDGYFFQHLAYHLVEARREDEMRCLLLNFEWLKAKLEATDIPSLIADYDSLSLDSDTVLVRDSLRLSAHVLALDRTQLPGQLLGRMMAQPASRIQNMLDQIAQNGDEPWIRPMIPSLTPPGGPLLRTLRGHSGSVRAVAVTPDGKKAVSGSGDLTLKVWDLEKGVAIATFTGDWPIQCCAIGPDGITIVAGESSGRVHFLRLEGG